MKMAASAEAVAQRLLVRSLAANQPARLQVQGGCMEPLICAGDWVEIGPKDAVRRGRIVLARDAAGQLVCHRVLACDDEAALLAGDRSMAVEKHSLDSLFGVVRGLERAGAVHRLGGWPASLLDRLLAGLHLRCFQWRGKLAGRVLDALRRRWVAVRAPSP